MEDIFCAAIEIGSAAEREVFLGRECGGDRELRMGVDQLLAAQPRAEEFFRGINPAEILGQPQP